MVGMPIFPPDLHNLWKLFIFPFIAGDPLIPCLRQAPQIPAYQIVRHCWPMLQGKLVSSIKQAEFVLEYVGVY